MADIQISVQEQPLIKMPFTNGFLSNIRLAQQLFLWVKYAILI